MHNRYDSKYKSVGWFLGVGLIVHCIIGFAIYLISPDAVTWLVRNDFHWGVFVVSLIIGSAILDHFENKRRIKFWEDLDKSE